MSGSFKRLSLLEWLLLFILVFNIGAAMVIMFVSVANDRATTQVSEATHALNASIGGLAMAVSVRHDITATPHAWHYIVLHHSGNDNDTIEGIRSWHVDHNGWRAIGYHFIVKRDGEIYVTERWRRQWDGAHCKTRNKDGIGICLVGDLRGHQPTDAQARAAATLVDQLQRDYRIDDAHVIGHHDAAATECPGSLTWQGLRLALASR